MADEFPGQTASGDAGAQATAWSPAQRARLEGEWRKLRRGFAFHPHVRVVPSAGEPPEEYEVEYRVRTLTVDAAGELAYVDACTLHVWLPPQFPHAAPVVRARAALFHPNVSGDWLHVTPAWNPATGSLAELVSRCGELLAFQVYDPAAVYNHTAMQWIAQYPHLVPTDPNAVFAPDAGGGDGVARIVKAGPQALEDARGQLTEMSLAILEAGPGTAPADVRAFGARMSAVLNAFADPDVPAHLRSRAAELDEWARSMTPERSIWDELRSLYADTRAAAAAGRLVLETRGALEAALGGVETLLQVDPADDPRETVALLPVTAVLDPLAIRLRQAVRGAEEQVGALRSALQGLSGPPPAPVGTPGGLLHERTRSDVGRGSAQAAAAREAGLTALQQIEPLVARARAEQAAAEHLVAWAGFTELVRRGNEMTQRLIERGADGIQAYHVQTPGGTFGPYQFEERIELGTALLVVRRIGAGPVEVFDARSMAAMGKGPGAAGITFADDAGKAQEAEVRATEHTDELRVQLEYLTKTSREQLAALGKPSGGGGGGAKSAATKSRAARFSAALGKQEALTEAADVYRRASHRWTALLADLDELAQFKERLATHHLLTRHATFVPAVLAVRAKAVAALDEANQRLAFIAARSTRDTETGQMIVPAALAAENMERLKQREKAERDVAKIRKLLSLVGAELQIRLANRRLHGKPGLPVLRLLRLPPEGYAGAEEWSSDERLRELVRELDRLMGTNLSAWTAEPEGAAAEPSAKA